MDVTSLISELVAIDSVNPALVRGRGGRARDRRRSSRRGRRRKDCPWSASAAPRPSVVVRSGATEADAAVVRAPGHGRRRGDDRSVRRARARRPALRPRRVRHEGGRWPRRWWRVARRRPRGLGVVVAAVADEEHASLGVQEVLASGLRADAAVVTEPTHGEVVHRPQGLRVDGDHGARPRRARLDARRRASTRSSPPRRCSPASVSWTPPWRTLRIRCSDAARCTRR